MNGRTRLQLRTDVVEAVYDATTDARRGGVTGQETLARLVQCSTATLTAEMPEIVKLSKERYPGCCLQIGQVQRRGRAAVYRYRVVDLQASAEMEATRTRCKQARTKIERAINEMEVRQAGPVAGAAVELIDAGLGLLVRGMARYEQAIFEAAGTT